MAPLLRAQRLPTQNCSLVSDYFISKPPVSVDSLLVYTISKKCTCPVITDSFFWGGIKYLLIAYCI